MIRNYKFCGFDEFKFDDSKTVKELVEYAFQEFDYYEPFGMDTVTVFQPYYSKTTTGWFTTDTSRKCADEIEDCEWLCYAYNIPGDFYYAEGGWGHHMSSLGNHPVLQSPVQLKLKFNDFRNDVVFRGTMTFSEVIDRFVEAEYICRPDEIKINVLAYSKPNYSFKISMNDMILSVPLTKFVSSLYFTYDIVEIELD